MIILGLVVTRDYAPGNEGPFYQDKGAALIVDGTAVSVMDRDKLAKKGKNKASTPFPVVRFVLRYYGIKLNQVDKIALLANPGELTGDPAAGVGRGVDTRIIEELQQEFRVDLSSREFFWVKPHWAYALNGFTLSGYDRCLCMSLHAQDGTHSLAVLKVEQNTMDQLDSLSWTGSGELPARDILACLNCHQHDANLLTLCITGNKPLPPLLQEEIASSGTFRDIFSQSLESAAGWALGTGLYLYRKEAPSQQAPVTYEAYRNNTERILTEIWQQVLSREKIGIHDDFFNLGGNSMKVIQVAAKLKTHGLELDTRDLYQFPTIKELAAKIKKNQRIIDQATVEGEVPLTPIQLWFWENSPSDRHHFNQSVMLYSEPGFNREWVEKIFTTILQHHDALRMVFETGGKRIIQGNRNLEGKLFDLEVIHLDESFRQLEKKIETQASRIQAGMDLARGPLVKLGLFKTSQGDYLLIAIHHFVVDGISWRILLEDINTGYQQLSRGEAIKFPDKTDSFQYWSRMLNQYASGIGGADPGGILKELEYWKNIEDTKIEPLPRDRKISNEKRKYQYNEYVKVELSRGETENLVQKVNRAYQTGINDILLTALGLAVKEWAGIDHVLINLEGHGRESIFPGEELDINRTVGWFTAQYPVILDMKKNGDLSDSITRVKETLGTIPNKGIGYGILRYFTPPGKKGGTVFAVAPEISFNYLGDYDRYIDVTPGAENRHENHTALIEMSGMSRGNNVSPGFKNLYTIDISAMIVEGKLNLSFAYNRLEYLKQTVERLLTGYRSNLLKVIRHCMEQEKKKSNLNETERILTGIWQQVLSREKIGLHDNFFDLGGNSLTVIRLENEIHKAFHKRLSLAEIFQYPTIKELSSRLQDQAEEKYSAITPIEKKECYALSSAQQRLYLVQQMELESIGYNVTQAIVFPGVPDMDRLKQVFNRLLARHQSLRTSFHMAGDEPVQRITAYSQLTLTLEYYDLESSNRELEAVIRDFIRPFDLSSAPLMRVGVVKGSSPGMSDNYLLLVDMHHIITDGTSQEIMEREFLNLYSKPGEEEPAPLKIQYKEFSEWQNSRAMQETIQKQEKYWLNQYQGEIPLLNLPTDFAPLKIQSFEGSMSRFEIPAQQTRVLKTIAMQEGTTLFVVLLTLQTIFFSKICGQEDIVTGTPLAGRRHADLEKVIGMFLSTLALRNYPAAEKPFIDFLREVKERTIEAFENQDYPFERLVEKLGMESIAAGNPLYRVMLILQNFYQQPGTSAAQNPNTSNTPNASSDRGAEKYEFERRASTNDMTLYVEELGDIIDCHWEYCTRLFKPGSMQRFIRYFLKIIESALESPQIKISEIRMIPENERHCLLFEFNHTQIEIVRNKCYHQLWEERAEGYSHRVAAVYRGVHITYHHLNTYAHGIAHFLVQHGAKPGSIIPVFMSRSIHMLASIIGIFKSDCVYLPIETRYPEERIKHMLEECDVKLLITQSRCLEVVERIREGLPFLETILDLDGGECMSKTLFQYPANNPHIPCQPNDLAYIIYTSGTTGKPKGVMIHHLGMLNHLDAKINDLDITGEDIIAQTASACFDISVWQFLAALLKGGCTFIIDKELVLDALKFLPVLQMGRITILESVPSLVTTFLEMIKNEKDKKLNHLKWMIMTGETLGVHLVRAWYHQYPGITLLNAYGPTEASDDVTHYVVRETPGENQDTIPIGKPVQNMHIYIMDRNSSLCGIGIRGEICTAGLGVGNGYWKDPDKTDKAFISNPFLEEIENNDYAVLYRTGDIGYFREDGSVECLGRLDQQVKIRGNRVELEEIENQLVNYQGIEEAVVTALNTVGTNTRDREKEYKYLCAYYVSQKEIRHRQLQEFLSRRLPDYMIPSFFVSLERLPLTPNGKVDRKALPVPGIEPEEQYTAPGNKLEVKLTEIWSGVLELPKGVISIDANFFRLGGHSLKAAALTAKVHRAFDVKLPLAEVFKVPTIRGLARCIKKLKEHKYVSMESTEKKEYYQLSSAQKRLYILRIMDELGISYNLPSVLTLEGDINKSRSEDSFKRLIERHESLRTSFKMVDDEPVQEVHNEVEFGIEYYDLQVTGASDRYKWEKEPFGQINACGGQYPKSQELRAKSFISSFIRPFDLSQAPLLRVGLVKIEEAKHLLMVDMHHIITDGVSQEIFTQEFMVLYSEEELPLLQFQYKDFAGWQQGGAQRETIKKQEEYWEKQFEGEIPALHLPADYPRPDIQSFAGQTISFQIGEERTAPLNQLALAESSSLYMVLMALYTILLAKITGQEDIVVGTPVAGRGNDDLQRIIGMFANTLATRNYPAGEKTFTAFLQEVKERTLEDFEHQDYPFEDLVDKLAINRDAGRNPLFDVMFVMQNMNFPEIKIPGLYLKPYPFYKDASIFDLNLQCFEVEKNPLFTLEYCTELFDAVTIERFIYYFRKIISIVTGNPGIKIADIEIISGEEKKQLLFDFNDTVSHFPQEKTIHRLFEEQVDRTPDHIAAVFKRRQLSYKQLNASANRLAWLLREKGVKTDIIVGIMLKRSLEMLMGIIAILKAGGAYLPIDAQYPGERKKYMLTDSKVKLLLTNFDRENAVDYVLYGIETIDLRDENIYIYEGKSNNPPCINTGADMVYVIYTSGSTGNPKGVILEHGNLVNLLDFQYKSTNINCSKILQFSTISFDASFHEIFSALLAGGTICLVDANTRTHIPGLFKYIDENRIKTLFLPISFLKLIFGEDDYIKLIPGCITHIQTAGDQVVISRNFKEYLNRDNVFLHNHYGPSETHVVTTLTINPRGEIPELPSIGKPIANTSIYILDRNNRLLPRGAPGELWIGGVQVGRGYLNNPELTAEKFDKDLWDYRDYQDDNQKFLRGGPGGAVFSKSAPTGRRRQKLYKTGDLARWLPEGNIEFLGRIDSQVKIRGFRVELGEIESQLLGHNRIKNAAVVVKTDKSGDKCLCAYVVAGKESNELSISELRAFLSEKLPGYMIPAFFVLLDHLPLTPNGKVDRKALPTIDMTLEKGYMAPRNELEKTLVKIWSEVLDLDREKISIDANFFELGGHSLKATVMIAKVNKALNKKFPLAKLFKIPTIKGLSENMRVMKEDKYVSVKPVEKKEYYRLSSAQKRLYFLQQMELQSTAYNLTNVFSLWAEIEIRELENAFIKLIRRQESLRTSFEMVEEEPVQRIHDRVEFEIEYKEVEEEKVPFGQINAFGGQYPESQELRAKSFISSFIRPFDLSRAGQLRVGIIKLAHPPSAPGGRASPGGKKNKYLLMVDMHHIISDAVSEGKLIEDFLSIYREKNLPSLRIQYKDFSGWQTSDPVKESLEQQEQYWLSQFSGEIPTLDLPTDYSRPATRTFAGRHIPFEISGQESTALRKLAQEQGATLFMVLLAITAIFLSKLTGQEEVITGTPIAGRNHSDLEQIIGMFVNTLALRNYPGPGKTFVEFLSHLKERTLSAFENQDYPFEELVEKLKIKRDSSRNPLFDVMFACQNALGLEEKMALSADGDYLEPENYQSEDATSKFDLSLDVVEREKLLFVLEYNVQLFKPESIDQFIIYFKEIVSAVVKNKNIKLKDIAISIDFVDIEPILHEDEESDFKF